MARKLKVFQARLGFHDTVVAAPSQAAALRAWGTHLDLFADGTAAIATDEAAVAVALAHPEVPLRRAVGTSDPFGLKAGTPRLPETPGGEPQDVAKAPAPRKPEPPDRSALDAADARLQAIEKDGNRELARFSARDDALAAEEDDLRRRRAQLDAERAAAREEREQMRADAKATLARERRAYRKAGGDLKG